MYTLRVFYLLSLLFSVFANYPGISQVGLGYDILKGNPDGGEFSSGNMDPGLKINKKIVEITPVGGGEKYRELSITNYDSCSPITESRIINDLASYRDELLQDIHFAETGPYQLESVAFAKSRSYALTNNQLKAVDNVLIDNRTECSKGVVTYNDHLVEDQKFNLTREYRMSVCHLPNRYDSSKYLNFLDHWGTHFVVEINFGHKEMRRYSVPIETLIRTVRSFDSYLISETTTNGVSNSELDVTGFPGSTSSEQTIGVLQHTYRIGTESNPVPIQLKLMSILETLQDKYWQDLPNDVEACQDHAYQDTLLLKSYNMKTALMEYKTNSHIAEPIVKTLTYSVQVTTTPLPHLQPVSTTSKPVQPIQWPEGTYGLPKTIHGCPSGGGNVIWSTGTLVQDTEDSGNDDGESPNLRSLLNAWASDGHVTTEFCMKTSGAFPTTGQTWPSGSYCILKKHDCPSGFLVGYVLWDDEDSFNSNHENGELPDGAYGAHSKTQIYYCCRDDGRPDKEIELPTESDFVLYPKGAVCQRVKGMAILEPWIRFDTEDTDNANYGYGAHPRFSITDSDIVVNYCYYKRVSSSQSIMYSPLVG